MLLAGGAADDFNTVKEWLILRQTYRDKALTPLPLPPKYELSDCARGTSSLLKPKCL